jgi:hypothetical protein
MLARTSPQQLLVQEIMETLMCYLVDKYSDLIIEVTPYTIDPFIEFTFPSGQVVTFGGEHYKKFAQHGPMIQKLDDEFVYLD